MYVSLQCMELLIPEYNIVIFLLVSTDWQVNLNWLSFLPGDSYNYDM